MTKTKSSSRRPKSAGNSPAPCGHSSCGPSCNVRYVGPTTHIRDHHIVHAARGVAHVWTASIVAGLAVVLTGAIAYTAVQAAPSPADASLAQENQSLTKQLNRMEVELKKLEAACTPAPVAQPAGPSDAAKAPSTGVQQ